MNFIDYTSNITFMQQRFQNNLNKLGLRIRNLRLNQSKSLNALVLGREDITTATWSRIENGKVNVKFSTLIEVASVLGITLDELLKDVDFSYSKE